MSSDSTIRCLCDGRGATGSVGRTIHRDMRTKLGMHYAFHSPRSCMLPLHRLVRRKKLDVRAVSGQMESVLHIGFLANLFSAPCRAGLTLTSGRIGDGTRRRITLRTSHRKLILLGGTGGLLPLSGSRVGHVTMYNPGTSRTSFTLARCNPMTMRMAAMLRNVGRRIGRNAGMACAGKYSLMSAG